MQRRVLCPGTVGGSGAALHSRRRRVPTVPRAAQDFVAARAGRGPGSFELRLPQRDGAQGHSAWEMRGCAHYFSTDRCSSVALALAALLSTRPGIDKKEAINI